MAYRQPAGNAFSENETDSDYEDRNGNRKRRFELSTNGHHARGHDDDHLPCAITSKRPRRRRNQVWRDVMRENELDNALAHTHMLGSNTTTVSRGVESYTLPSDNTYHSDSSTDCLPPDRSEPSSRGLDLPGAVDCQPSQNIDIEVSEDARVVGSVIAKNLEETNQELIIRVVAVLGDKLAVKFNEMTEDVEASGGLHCLMNMPGPPDLSASELKKMAVAQFRMEFACFLISVAAIHVASVLLTK